MKRLFAIFMFASAAAWFVDFLNPEDMSVTMIRVALGVTIASVVGVGVWALLDDN